MISFIPNSNVLLRNFSQFSKKVVGCWYVAVYVVAHSNFWEIPPDIEDQVILPPNAIVRVGRPRKHRIRAAYELERNVSVRCSSCGVSGHNKRTCPGAK